MVDAEALDPSMWNVGGYLSQPSGRLTPTNLLSTLYVGLSGMDARLFRKLDRRELAVDPERFKVLRALVDTLDSWSISPMAKAQYGWALKRFVRWADDTHSTISRTTIVPLMASYCGDAADHLAAIRRLASAALDVSDDERNLILPAAPAVESAGDEWVSTIDTGSMRISADFLRFIVAGDAALPVFQFAELREHRQADVPDDRSSRTEFMRALCKEFRAHTTARTYSPATLVKYFAHLRSWVVWADEQGLALDKDSAIDALVLYSQHLSRLWEAGRLSESTVHAKVMAPAYILCGLLDRQTFEIVYRLRMPPITSSVWTSTRPATASLQEFCSNLNAILRVLPSETLCSQIHAPIQVELRSEGEILSHVLPLPYGGFDDQGFDPRIANLPLTRIRIWAELYRFVVVTGCNLSVAQDLTIGDWRANGLLMVALKNRANKFISVRVNRLYEKHLAAYVEFLEAALPLSIEDDTPLFPGVRFSRQFRTPRDLVACLRAKTTAPRASVLDPWREPGVDAWVKSNGLTLTSRQLRLAKATWLFRRHSGDSLRVSRELGNTPQGAYSHYGGKGNLEQAIPEWSRHWASPQSAAALAPGKCESPGRYEPVHDEGTSPRSCNAGACLGCWHYRGEESLDYIHRMLSFRYCLCHRAASNAEVARLIDIIDQIVDAYLERHSDQRDAVRSLQLQISHRAHSQFAAMIRLAEIMHAI